MKKSQSVAWGLASLLASAAFAANGAPSDEAKQPEYQLDEMYASLREMAFTTGPDALGLKPASPDEVWGVVMETGFPESVATLVAFAEGSVSLYFSSGGGTIGLGEHEGPHRAAEAWLAAAQKFASQALPTTTYPLPPPESTRFFLLTGRGVLTLEAKEEDLGENRHPFSPLFHLGHRVLTEIRLFEESREQE